MDLDWIQMDEGVNSGFCEYGTEIFDSLESRKFLDRLSEYYHLKEDSAIEIIICI
jgi:hypothetical protein